MSGNPFQRVAVDYLTQGGSRVHWELSPNFCVQPPYEFQLQVSSSRGEPGTWVNVGNSVTDTFTAIDSSRRNCGKPGSVVYRVLLAAGESAYVSEQAHVYGDLTTRQWLLAKALVRRATLEHANLPRLRGYLLRRKQHGTVCTCVDPLTGLVKRPNHSLCAGTGRIQGYWNGVSVEMLDMTPTGSYKEVDEQDVQGTTDSTNDRVGKFIGLPTIETRDVWVLAGADQRYVVHAVKHAAEIGNVPLIVHAELRLLPLSDPAYAVNLE